MCLGVTFSPVDTTRCRNYGFLRGNSGTYPRRHSTVLEFPNRPVSDKNIPRDGKKPSGLGDDLVAPPS